jgi:hypothetical protein
MPRGRQRTDEHASLWGEYVKSREELFESATKLYDMTSRSVEMRMAFFEKLVLVAAGSFALTFTFLSYLRGHLAPGNVIQGLGYLKVGWGMMLICILSAGLHNVHQNNRLDKFSDLISSVIIFSRKAEVFKAVSKLNVKTDAMDPDKTITKLNDLTDQMAVSSRYARAVGSVSILSIAIAFVMLFIFALKNVSSV